VKFPHPITPSQLPEHQGLSTMGRAQRREWAHLDGKVKTHNMAKRIALLPHKDARNSYVNELAVKHHPETIARLKRLIVWYWRAQRKLQRAAA
jgi:hypothetical protein